jgi:hypothetical protein
LVSIKFFERDLERLIHRRDAENAENNIFSIGGRYRQWKTTHRFANPNPPQAAGSFIKSVSPDFMKNKFLGVLCASAVKKVIKRLTCYDY